MTPHMLRHTSLMELRNAGWRDEHLMKRAGHAHIQTTMQIINEGKVQELNRFISGYWENDIWDANDPIFNDFRKSDWEKTHRKMNFSDFSPC